ncbi:MAG: hypothetical protein CME71_11635 [Halobacteriovorax sp.]|nr:hypothetical protein [Halobacteriovorax sp.]|tara:strand:- start:91 stop:459 length:369 start_codon:yes stop_codon:yes gene_type:complete
MKQFIAIVASEGGEVTKYQDFDTETEANNHVRNFGGFVAPNPGNNTKCWIIDDAAKTLTLNEEMQTEIERSNTEYDQQEYARNRAAAYQAESDPLFFEEQAGEVAAGTHAEKRAEIKTRFPK